MKKLIQLIPAISVGILIFGYIGLRFYNRWENYQSKALFLNTYAYSNDQPGGKYTWHWSLNPGPVSDGAGHLALVDYESNMLVILIYPDGDPKQFNWGANYEQFFTNVGPNKITIHRKNDVLLAVTSQGIQVIKTLQPDEAKSIFTNLQQTRDAGDPIKLKAALATLLGSATTEPTTMTATQPVN